MMVLGIVSLAIASLALGWNIYKDILQKPRFKASMGVYDVMPYPKMKTLNPFIMFSGINFGPGDIVIKNIILKYRRKERPFAIVLPELEWGKIPQKVSVGEEAQVFTKYFEKCFLSTNFIKAGLLDSFGRKHWVSERNITEARDRYIKDFGDSSSNE